MTLDRDLAAEHGQLFLGIVKVFERKRPKSPSIAGSNDSVSIQKRSIHVAMAIG